MALVLKYVRQIWPAMVVIIGITFLATFVTILRPLVAAGVINLTLEQIGYSSSPKTEATEQSEMNFFDLNQVGSLITDLFFEEMGRDTSIVDAIPYFVALMLFLSLAAGLVKYAGHFLNALARSRIMSRLRDDLSSYLLTLDLSFFTRQRSGDLTSRVLADAHAVGQGVVSATHRIIHSLLLIAVYFVFLLNTSVILTVLIAVIVLGHYLVTTALTSPIKKYEVRNLEALASLTSSLQEVFSNIRLIQSQVGSPYSTRSLQDQVKKSSNAYFKTQVVGGIEPESRYVLDGLAEGLVLLVAISQLFSGSINVEGFLLYVYVARLVLGPINECSTYFVWLQRIFASSTRINEYFSEKTSIVSGPETAVSFRRCLEFRNVEFAHNTDPVLQDLSFSLEKMNSLL